MEDFYGENRMPECAKRPFMQNGVESLIKVKDLQVTVVKRLEVET